MVKRRRTEGWSRWGRGKLQARLEDGSGGMINYEWGARGRWRVSWGGLPQESERHTAPEEPFSGVAARCQSDEAADPATTWPVNQNVAMLGTDPFPFQRRQ